MSEKSDQQKLLKSLVFIINTDFQLFLENVYDVIARNESLIKVKSNLVAQRINEIANDLENSKYIEELLEELYSRGAQPGQVNLSDNWEELFQQHGFDEKQITLIQNIINNASEEEIQKTKKILSRLDENLLLFETIIHQN